MQEEEEEEEEGEAGCAARAAADSFPVRRTCQVVSIKNVPGSKERARFMTLPRYGR